MLGVIRPRGPTRLTAILAKGSTVSEWSTMSMVAMLLFSLSGLSSQAVVEAPLIVLQFNMHGYGIRDLHIKEGTGA